MDAYSTHLPVLATLVANVSGPVWELGAGDYSTPLLHLMCGNLRKLITFESDPAYLEKYQHLQTKMHAHVHVKDWSTMVWEEWVATAGRPSIILVDHEPIYRRMAEVCRLRDTATYLVIHDVENSARVGRQHLFPQFSYGYIYTQFPVQTAIVSNSQPIPLCVRG